MREVDNNRIYEVNMAWKSRLDRTVVSSFEVQVIENIPGIPDGIVVKIKKFIHGSDTHKVTSVEDLPKLMKEEVLALISGKVEIHRDSLDDYDINYVRNPLSLRPG